MNRRRFVAAVAIAATVTTGGVAFARWSNNATGSATASSTTVNAATSVAGNPSTKVVSWTLASVANGAPAPTYTVERSPDNGTSTRDWSTTACSGANAASTSCTDTATIPSAAGTYDYRYRVVASYQSWTATSVESAKVSYVVVPASTPPATPTGVTLSNGQGNGSLWVNNATKAVADFTVDLPSSSKTSDVVHLTVADAGAVHTVTAPTVAGSNGQGSVLFNDVNLTSLSDGALTVTAWATNADGPSGNKVVPTYSKDVVLPVVSALTVTSNGTTGNGKGLSGTAGKLTNDVLTVNLSASYVSGTGGNCSVSAATAPVNNSTGAWSGVTASMDRSTTCSVTVTQLDAAGNVGSNSGNVTRG